MHKDPHIANMFSAEEEDCLRLEQMTAYQQGKLVGQEKHQVERHLLNCELCAITYEMLEEVPAADLSAGAAEVADKAWANLQDQAQKRRKGAIFWIASAASIALLVVVGYFSMQGPSAKEIDDSIAEAIEATPPLPVQIDTSSDIAMVELNTEDLVAADDLKDARDRVVDGTANTKPPQKPDFYAEKGKMEAPVQEGKAMVKSSPSPVYASGKDDIKGSSSAPVVSSTTIGQAAAKPSAAPVSPKAMTQDVFDSESMDDLAWDQQNRDRLDGRMMDSVYLGKAAVSTDAYAATSTPSGGLERKGNTVSFKISESGKSSSRITMADEKSKKAAPGSKSVVNSRSEAAATVVESTPSTLETLEEAEKPAAKSSFDEGMLAYKEADYKQAARELRKTTEASPNNLEAHIYAADAFLRISQPQAALFHIDRVLAVPGNSHFEDAEWYKALAYLQLKDVAKAQSQLKLVIARGGKFKARAEKALQDIR